MNKRLGYFAAGALAFVLCGFGIPGPQGGGGVASGSSPTFGDVTADSLILDSANADTTIERISAGAIRLVSAAQPQFRITSAGASTTYNHSIDGTGHRLASGMNVQWSSTSQATSSADLYLRRSAASTLTVDGDGSGTTAGRLAVSGIAPMSSSTDLTLYDNTGTAKLTVGSSMTFTSTRLFSTNYTSSYDNVGSYWGTANDAGWFWGTAQTNDALMLRFLGGAGGSTELIMCTNANSSTDLGLSDKDDPTLVLTSATAWSGDTTEWASLSVATGGAFTVDTGNSGHAINLNVAASNIVQVANGQVAMNRALHFGTGIGSVANIQGPSDQDLRIFGNGTNSLRLGTNSTTALTLDSSQNAGFAGIIDLPQKIQHSADGDTHFQFAVDEITLTAGNVAMLTLTESTTDTATFGTGVQVQADDGSASAPAYSFSSDTDSGLSLASAGIVDMNIGGSLVTRWNGSTLTLQTGIDLRANDDCMIQYGNNDVFEQGELTTLTDNTATTVFSVVTGDGDMGGVVIHYTIQSTDGTEYQSESGTVHIAVVDDAGGVVADVNESSNTAQAVSSGTLTSTWSIVTTDDQSLEVQVNADTSLTPSTHQIRWKATCSGDVTLVVP